MQALILLQRQLRYSFHSLNLTESKISKKQTNLQKGYRVKITQNQKVTEMSRSKRTEVERSLSTRHTLDILS